MRKNDDTVPSVGNTLSLARRSSYRRKGGRFSFGTDGIYVAKRRTAVMAYDNEQRYVGTGNKEAQKPTKSGIRATTSKKYNLYEFKDFYPNQLSGGMKQRVALIRTLVLEPKLLLLDEPFSALDFQTRLNVVEDVYSILKSEGKSAVFVTHDISEAISLCDRVVILTNRPSTVKEVVDLSPLKDYTPLQRRELPVFSEYFDKIWSNLQTTKEKNDETTST